jgi:hypothetical protein
MWRRWKRGHDQARSRGWAGCAGRRSGNAGSPRSPSATTVVASGSRKASRRTKTEAKNKLRYMLREQADGLPVGSHRSKSLSAGQADDVLTKTAPDRLHAYIANSLRLRGRYWVRTSDLFGVNEARYHCANRPLSDAHHISDAAIGHEIDRPVIAGLHDKPVEPQPSEV